MVCAAFVQKGLLIVEYLQSFLFVGASRLLLRHLAVLMHKAWLLQPVNFKPGLFRSY
jgi:hypothetical protein